MGKTFYMSEPNPDIKKMSDINRAEWIVYEWIEVTLWTDTERMYIRGPQRPIEDAPVAAEQFDVWVENYRALNG